MTGERELFYLLEAVEGGYGGKGFSLAPVDNWQWHLARPSEQSETMKDILELESNGYLTIGEMADPGGTGRRYVRAEITPEGRKRIDELVESGIEPEAIDY